MGRPPVRKSPAKETQYKPPDILQILDKDPKYVYRFINVNAAETASGGMDPRGWEIVRKGAINEESNPEFKGLFTSNSLGSTIRVGDLVAARMPREKAKERREYYAELNKRKMLAIKDPKSLLTKDEKQHFEQDVDLRTNI